PYIGDEPLLQRLIANLLDNAIKYSPAGGTIVVRFERVGEEFRLSVSNGGGGIPPSAREHLFDGFFRVDAARTLATSNGAVISGSGLGLPIARWIAERHG